MQQAPNLDKYQSYILRIEKSKLKQQGTKIYEPYTILQTTMTKVKQSWEKVK